MATVSATQRWLVVWWSSTQALSFSGFHLQLWDSLRDLRQVTEPCVRQMIRGLCMRVEGNSIPGVIFKILTAAKAWAVM